jgi:hypothetical protein
MTEAISVVKCLVCGHLATDHSQEGLSPCKKWLDGPGSHAHRCPCPNFLIDMRSVPDEITHSELDKKAYEFFETVGVIAEQLQRIGDLIELREK